MKKTFSSLLKFILISCTGFIGGIVATFLMLQSNKFTSTSTNNTQTTVSKVSYKNTNDTTSAVANVQDAVVSVINYQSQQNNSFQNVFGNSPSGELAVASEGSGVIYKKDGKFAYIVTNNHVIEGAEQIEILFADGTKVVGELVGSDTYSDLAVVKISSESVKTVATFADSETLTVGETAIAIGSPLGSEYANSVTEGIVSSLSRTVTMKNEQGETISTNAIQTDAAINPGNSGGALINIQGQVIGINSSKISSTSTSLTGGSSVEGMGFAIPSNDVVKIINQLEKNGKVNRPALGITMVGLNELSTNFIFQLKLPEDVTSGIVVASTQDNMPASGKLQKYDVITEIDEETVASSSDLQSILYGHTIGDTIKVTLYREGKKQTATIILDKTTQDLTSN
ncbi:S1C family serine protease [Streptococcus hillyeri]|uniref:Serine protease n=1 Tax=Streptococcus hillyeri TaxID=2282420 RepID=A0A3L9DTU5_9STRE|nr:S1C family serine protease [Streptococcus hillyeri]RLY03443.1 serine protease [Streptococcus hillyeri]